MRSIFKVRTMASGMYMLLATEKLNTVHQSVTTSSLKESRDSCPKSRMSTRRFSGYSLCKR